MKSIFPGAPMIVGLALFLVGVGCSSIKSNESRTVKALLVTGGCCHDYETQAKVLTTGIGSNAWNEAKITVQWTVVNQGGKSTNAKIPLHENPNWAKGFDIVVHNECYADVADEEWIRRVTQPHFEGTPAVVIHCAMHTYRAAKSEDWHDFLGVTSHHHEPSRKFQIRNIAPNHPIMKGFPANWTPPVDDELYVITKTSANCVSLAVADGTENKGAHPCVWINQFGKGRVFGLTTGHRTETLADVKYLEMISRGFIWAVGR